MKYIGDSPMEMTLLEYLEVKLFQLIGIFLFIIAFGPKIALIYFYFFFNNRDCYFSKKK